MTASRLTVCVVILLASRAAWAEPPKADGGAAASAPATTRSPAKRLRVSAVQMRSIRDLEANLRKTEDFIRRCGRDGARVVVFPECSVTGYFEDVVRKVTAEQLAAAEQRVGDACRQANVHAIVGMPWRQGGKLFNAAVVIGPDGRVIERYFKMQLVESWADPGDHLSVWRIDGVPCAAIVCHDERYPELVRLPVLAGARIVFYLSHESGLHEERKLDPYRAQIQARAVENGVFVVHANAPANVDATGSHGQSRIIAPDGNIVREAGFFAEEVVTADLDLSRASRGNATGSLRSDLLRSWWQEGLKLVRNIE